MDDFLPSCPLERRKEVVFTQMEDPKDIQRILYDFAEELGHGKFAKVIRAINKEYKDKWTIKIIAKNRNPGSDRMKNLMREIDILWRVDHPHILKLEQVIDTPKKLYLVLEMGKKALGTVLEEKKLFTEDEARNVMKQLSEAVAYLHDNDIVHKDLSLETVLLVRNPRDFNDEMYVKLTGFGAGVTMSPWDCKYRLPDYIGNSFYHAPEVLKKRQYSALSDVWAMGVILFLLLTGEFPFIDYTKETVATWIFYREPDYTRLGDVVDLNIVHPLLRNYNDSIATRIDDGWTVHLHKYRVEALLRRMLDKNPDTRIWSQSVLYDPWINDRDVTLPFDDYNMELRRQLQTAEDHFLMFGNDRYEPVVGQTRRMSVVNTSLTQDEAFERVLENMEPRTANNMMDLRNRSAATNTDPLPSRIFLWVKDNNSELRAKNKKLLDKLNAKKKPPPKRNLGKKNIRSPPLLEEVWTNRFIWHSKGDSEKIISVSSPIIGLSSEGGDVRMDYRKISDSNVFSKTQTLPNIREIESMKSTLVDIFTCTTKRETSAEKVQKVEDVESTEFKLKDTTNESKTDRRLRTKEGAENMFETKDRELAPKMALENILEAKSTQTSSTCLIGSEADLSSISTESSDEEEKPEEKPEKEQEEQKWNSRAEKILVDLGESHQPSLSRIWAKRSLTSLEDFPDKDVAEESETSFVDEECLQKCEILTTILDTLVDEFNGRRFEDSWFSENDTGKLKLIKLIFEILCEPDNEDRLKNTWITLVSKFLTDPKHGPGIMQMLDGISDKANKKREWYLSHIRLKKPWLKKASEFVMHPKYGVLVLPILDIIVNETRSRRSSFLNFVRTVRPRKALVRARDHGKALSKISETSKKLAYLPKAVRSVWTEFIESREKRAKEVRKKKSVTFGKVQVFSYPVAESSESSDAWNSYEYLIRDVFKRQPPKKGDTISESTESVEAIDLSKVASTPDITKRTYSSVIVRDLAPCKTIVRPRSADIPHEHFKISSKNIPLQKKVQPPKGKRKKQKKTKKTKSSKIDDLSKTSVSTLSRDFSVNTSIEIRRTSNDLLGTVKRKTKKKRRYPNVTPTGKKIPRKSSRKSPPKLVVRYVRQVPLVTSDDEIPPLIFQENATSLVPEQPPNTEGQENATLPVPEKKNRKKISKFTVSRVRKKVSPTLGPPGIGSPTGPRSSGDRPRRTRPRGKKTSEGPSQGCKKSMSEES